MYVYVCTMYVCMCVYVYTYVCVCVLRSARPYFPLQVTAMLGLASPDMSHDPEAVSSLVGCDCVQLVQHLPLASLPEYTLFLTQLLDSELKEVPRGVAYSTLRQPMALERELTAIPGKLQGLCASQCARDGTAGLITGQW